MLWLTDRIVFTYRQNEEFRARLGMPPTGEQLRVVK
jgi:hypothetical protein